MAKSENKNWTQKKFLEEKILLDWISSCTPAVKYVLRPNKL